jgi:hypothetical protein
MRIGREMGCIFEVAKMFLAGEMNILAAVGEEVFH